MEQKIRLGFVGTGMRAAQLMYWLYKLRDQRYLQNEQPSGDPDTLYLEYGNEVPSWSEDVSDLRPEITAVFDPNEEALQNFSQLCGGTHDASPEGNGCSGRWADFRDGTSDLPPEPGDDPETFRSFDEFLEAESYDAVVVASDNDVHVNAVVPLLERDVHILCEKPVVTDLDDYDRLFSAAASANAVFYPGYNLRTSPLFSHYKELLTNGAVGRLGMIGCHEVRGPFSSGSYHYSQEASGGALPNKNCHDFDLFNWYAEGDPVRVAAFGGQHILSEGTDVNDHATVIVEYDTGVKATLELCLYAPFTQNRRRVYTFRGTEGLVRSPEEEGSIELFTKDDRHTFGVGVGGGHGGADMGEVRTFLRCVRGDEEPPLSVQDAKKAESVALAAETAIGEGRIVEIDSEYDFIT